MKIKQILLVLVVLSILTSCKKEEGYMFKAFHHVKGSDTTDCFGHVHSRIISDYFQYPEKDQRAAEEFYLKRMAADETWDSMLETDSTWVEYYCTAEEWKKKGI